MWVSHPMSILTWPTRLTELNTKGQAEAAEFLSSLGRACQSYFQAYPVFAATRSQVAQGGELTTRSPRQAPVKPTCPPPPRTPRPLMCPSLLTPTALRRKSTLLSLAFKALYILRVTPQPD